MIEVINGIVRVLTPITVAWLIKRGLPEDQAAIISGYIGDTIIAAVTLAIGAWSAASNVRKNREIETLKKTLVLAHIRNEMDKPNV